MFLEPTNLRAMQTVRPLMLQPASRAQYTALSRYIHVRKYQHASYKDLIVKVGDGTLTRIYLDGDAEVVGPTQKPIAVAYILDNFIAMYVLTARVPTAKLAIIPQFIINSLPPTQQ